MINSKKPRIALLHYAAPPTIGGVESTVAAHAKLFADHGYPVKIITGRGEPFDARIPIEIIPTIDSSHSFVLSVHQKLERGIVTKDFHALTAAIHHALNHALSDVDVCIVHNALTLHKNLALTSALKVISKSQVMQLIAWSHDFAWNDPVYAHALFDGSPWDLLRQPWRGVRYVVVSESRKHQLRQLWQTESARIDVVPPGVDLCEFLGIHSHTAEWITQFDLLHATPLLLLPARITRRKNMELAIQITAQLQGGEGSPKLLVMGPLGAHNPTNKTYLDELRALRHRLNVVESVIFLQEYGPVSDRMRRDLYLLADALLFPSSREGFGIPILEAGLTRLPIFCSDIPPFRESAQDNANFFSLDESPGAIAVQIKSVLANDSHYRLKHKVIREYTWEHVFSDKIEPLLKERQAV